MCRYYGDCGIMTKEQQQGRAHQGSDTPVKRAPALSKCAHAVIFVLKAKDPRLAEGAVYDELQKIREQFKQDGNNNIHQIVHS